MERIDDVERSCEPPPVDDSAQQPQQLQQQQQLELPTHPQTFLVENDDVQLINADDDDDLRNLSSTDQFRSETAVISGPQLTNPRMFAISASVPPDAPSASRPTSSRQFGSSSAFPLYETPAQGQRRIAIRRMQSADATDPNEPASFDKYYLLAMLVCLCCNIPLGIIAFILAVVAQDKYDSTRVMSTARPYVWASVGVSFAGVGVGIIAIIVLGTLAACGILGSTSTAN